MRNKERDKVIEVGGQSDELIESSFDGTGGVELTNRGERLECGSSQLHMLLECVFGRHVGVAQDKAHEIGKNDLSKVERCTGFYSKTARVARGYQEKRT